MTLKDKIEIIDYMIKKTPDATIKDYRAVLKEFIETENEMNDLLNRRLEEVETKFELLPE